MCHVWDKFSLNFMFELPLYFYFFLVCVTLSDLVALKPCLLVYIRKKVFWKIFFFIFSQFFFVKFGALEPYIHPRDASEHSDSLVKINNQQIGHQGFSLQVCGLDPYY